MLIVKMIVTKNTKAVSPPSVGPRILSGTITAKTQNAEHIKNFYIKTD